MTTEVSETAPTRRNRGWIWFFVVLGFLTTLAALIPLWYNLSQQLTREQLDQALKVLGRANGGGEGSAKLGLHRLLGAKLQALWRRLASTEHDVPTRQQGSNVGEASSLEGALELRHLGIHGAHASEESNVSRHEARVFCAA